MKHIVTVCLVFILGLVFFMGSGCVLAAPVSYQWGDYDDWYYKKTAKYQGWKYIVVHHSATNAGSVRAFHRFHTKQGYGGVAYHFVIGNGNGMKDGEVQETFRWQQQMAGTHVSVNAWDHNVFGIGICLVGNLDKSAPTPAQQAALLKLIKRLQKQHHIPNQAVLGHQHVHYDDASGRRESTKCPGKKLDIQALRRKQIVRLEQGQALPHR